MVNQKNKVTYSSYRKNYTLQSAPENLYKKIDSIVATHFYYEQITNKYPSEYFTYNGPFPKTFTVDAQFKNTSYSAYKVNYNLDSERIRHVEYQSDKTNATKFAIFAGCSYAFGEGLPQGEDYPSQLAKKLDSTWKISNLGFHGNGPNDTVERYSIYKDYIKKIPQQEGVYTWHFIANHLTRFFCQANCYNPVNNWILTKQQIQLVDGELKSIGYFIHSSSLIRKMLLQLMKWNFFENFPAPDLKYTDQQIEEFAMAVDYIPQNTNKKFLKKYFMIDNDKENVDYAQLSRIMVSHGYEIINLRPYIDLIEPSLQKIPGDGHPTALVNWNISEVLKNILNEDFNPQ